MMGLVLYTLITYPNLLLTKSSQNRFAQIVLFSCQGQEGPPCLDPQLVGLQKQRLFIKPKAIILSTYVER